MFQSLHPHLPVHGAERTVEAEPSAGGTVTAVLIDPTQKRNVLILGIRYTDTQSSQFYALGYIVLSHYQLMASAARLSSVVD